MKRTLVFSILLVVALLAFTSSPAKADNIDFSCGSGTCSGTVVPNGSFFSTTGIGVTPGSTIAGESLDNFTLIFNTQNNTIQINENGVVDFAGTITSSSSSSSGGITQLILSVNWTTIPGDVSGNAGTTPLSSVITLTNNGTLNAWSVDVPINTSTVPEPSTILLLGAGLLLLGTKKLFAVA